MMRKNDKFWIGVGDIHEDISLLNEIPDLADAAGVIISGDITNRGGRRRAGHLLNAVSAINSNIYAQIGNMDRCFFFNDTTLLIFLRWLGVSFDNIHTFYNYSSIFSEIFHLRNRAFNIFQINFMYDGFM